jgi:glucosamine-6-phosphate deaminase
MRLIINNQVGIWAAIYVVKRINDFAPTAQRPFVLGLPTGDTPLAMYQTLVELYQAGQVSFRHVVTFNMDEYVGLPADHPQSYHVYMARHFFDHIDLPAAQRHILNGCAPDLQRECDRYEAAIQSCGGIELFMGGVGEQGHIAFNEPGSSLQSRTRVQALAAGTRRANARFFHGDPDKVPPTALTVGVGTIMEARQVIIMAQGGRKAQAVAQAIQGSVTPQWTVSALQRHPWALIVCDQRASLKLNVKTIRYFQALTDPLL